MQWLVPFILGVFILLPLAGGDVEGATNERGPSQTPSKCTLLAEAAKTVKQPQAKLEKTVAHAR